MFNAPAPAGLAGRSHEPAGLSTVMPSAFRLRSVLCSWCVREVQAERKAVRKKRISNFFISPKSLLIVFATDSLLNSVILINNNLNF